MPNTPLTLINPDHQAVQKHADKLLQIKQKVIAIEQTAHIEKVVFDFYPLVWTEEEILAFEKEKKLKLPEEYKVYLMEIGEVSQSFYRNYLNLSLKNRKVKEYTTMRKKTISANKLHNVGSIFGKGWIKESLFDILKDEDKFKLYRKIPLFAGDARYDDLFRLQRWNAYIYGYLSIGNENYLAINGEFEGEVWKYGSEPEGIYAPNKYRECFTRVSLERITLLDFIINKLGKIL